MCLKICDYIRLYIPINITIISYSL
jgi:hypothetical protein